MRMSGSCDTPLLSSYFEHLRPNCGHVIMNDQTPADLTVELGHEHVGTAGPISGSARTGDGVNIYYELHGLPDRNLDNTQHVPKVVMIMGLACGCNGWRWQLQDLVQQHRLTTDSNPMAQHARLQQDCTVQTAVAAAVDAVQQQLQQRMVVCILDNRGVGNSSSPTDLASYTTQIMAHDVLSVMDHLNWQQAHILGFSMGGMIAQSLAAAAPHRVNSLTLLATSAGGWQIIPLSCSGIRTALKMITARTAEDAADATLHVHFRRQTLKAWVSHLAARRQDLLRREYMTPSGISPAQPPHGFKGQLLACWRHKLSAKQALTIKSAGFPVMVIHGRNDKLASAANAENLARRLGAPCVILPGAHFIVRECAGQINMLLSSLVFGKQHFISVPNAPYMDPSPSILKLWSAGMGQQGESCGTGNRAVGTQASVQASVTLQSTAAQGPVAGPIEAKLVPDVNSVNAVDWQAVNGPRVKHH